MGFVLADDVLCMILDILGDERDHNSLFQCAISSRCFTAHSLAVLYKVCHASSLRGGGTEDEQFLNPRRRFTFNASVRREVNSTVRKWALLWQSIALSALGQTYLPYYSYLRYLDLDDLGDLLKDPNFSGRIRDDFFTPGLLEIASSDYQAKGNKRLRSVFKGPDPSADSVKLKIGSAIVKKATSIRGMSLNVPPETLSKWVEGLPLLQSLTVWSGEALSQHAGSQLRHHCPKFKELTIYSWRDRPPTTAEAESEQFLEQLQPNTLETFELISLSQLGPRSIVALGSHRQSLSELKLTSLTVDGIAQLPSLTALPSLRVLTLTDSVPSARDERFYTIVSQVAEWIGSCESLRQLEVRRFVDDPFLLSRTLTSEGVKLTSLSLSRYSMAGSQAFHEALACQQTLRTLNLSGESSFSNRDNEILVQALSQLSNLRELDLKDISDGFTQDHAMALTAFLPRLEKLWISGDFFDDTVFQAFTHLPKLESLVIPAFSKFTADGILDFISQLGPGNKGFNLSILNAVDSTLTEEAQLLISETLKANLDGSFDYGIVPVDDSDMSSEDGLYV
ncbi:RNI-like protein [Aspergillus indologenus CBS 114.80]|uniref:RNI-like protein n=1 Tax=Aspergillus indologenus CBS 114.80 TaxID=1450541 RepID=A0A2V5HXR2_9EURO|nr:RNI-like protein [Aspergillus indologenus CBS 114.80]